MVMGGMEMKCFIKMLQAKTGLFNARFCGFSYLLWHQFGFMWQGCLQHLQLPLRWGHASCLTMPLSPWGRSHIPCLYLWPWYAIQVGVKRMFDAAAFELATQLLFQPITLVMLVAGVSLALLLAYCQVWAASGAISGIAFYL